MINKQEKPHGVTQRENRIQRSSEAFKRRELRLLELAKIGHQQRAEELRDSLRAKLAAALQLGPQRFLCRVDALSELEHHSVLRLLREEIRLLDEETNETLPEEINPGDVESDQSVCFDDEESRRGEEGWSLLDGGEIGGERLLAFL